MVCRRDGGVLTGRPAAHCRGQTICITSSPSASHFGATRDYERYCPHSSESFGPERPAQLAAQPTAHSIDHDHVLVHAVPVPLDPHQTGLKRKRLLLQTHLRGSPRVRPQPDFFVFCKSGINLERFDDPLPRCRSLSSLILPAFCKQQWRKHAHVPLLAQGPRGCRRRQPSSP